MLGLAACQSTPTPAAPAPTHEGTNAILWLQTAAEYHAATLQAFRSATLHLERALADPTWSAATFPEPSVAIPTTTAEVTILVPARREPASAASPNWSRRP